MTNIYYVEIPRSGDRLECIVFAITSQSLSNLRGSIFENDCDKGFSRIVFRRGYFILQKYQNMRKSVQKRNK